MNIDNLTPQLLGKVLETKAWDIKLSNRTVICLIGNGSEYRINIYELMFKFRDYYKVQGIHLSLNGSVEEILEALIYIEEQ